jgi:ribose/xylose/arabinose/galactoside ABC-type transport system permease subunit
MRDEALPTGNAVSGSAGGKPVKAITWLFLRNPIGPLLVVALICFCVFVPFFATISDAQNMALETPVLLLLAGGGAVVLISGNFDLSSEGTLEFTSVLAAWLMVKSAPGGPFGLSPFIVLPLMVLVGCLIGVVNGVFVSILKVNPFIVTLTTMLTLKGAAAIPTQGNTIYQLPAAYGWVGSATWHGFSAILFVAVGLYALLWLYMRYSVFSRHCYAVGGNVSAAVENGVSAKRVVIGAYAISGGFAAIAGWLDAARIASASPVLDDGIIFTVFAAMVIGGISLTGGRGSLLGAAAGAVLMTSVNNVLNLVALPPLYVDFVRGLVLLIAVLLIVARQKLAARLGIQEPAW